ncbi:MAG: TPM domain-containing protein [Oscillospiraceae bacterium]|nr:TPM domain-containing protein [Oscillospiraceae bacterium]
MKAKLCALALALLLLLSLSVAAFAEGENETLEYYVSDAAGLLTAQQQQTLEAAARAASEKHGCGIYIITINDFREFGFGNVSDCAEGFYNHYQMGLGNERNGILLLLSMNDRDYALKAYGGGAHEAFTDYGSYRISDSFIRYFRNNDWYGGFADYISNAEDFLTRAAAGNPVDVPQNENTGLSSGVKTAMIVGIPALIAFGSCEGMKRKMKPVKQAGFADDYLLQGGIHLDVKKDVFVNRSVTRTVIRTERSSGGGGGGGTTINSGGFSGHSGKF